MSSYRVHTLESAPAGSKPTVEKMIQAWGFLPNLGGVLAESPAAAEAVFSLLSTLTGKGALSPVEQQLVAVVASRVNGCNYCVAAHSTMAVGAKTPPGLLRAARQGEPLPDAKIAVLGRITEKLVQERGWLSSEDQREFFAAGYSRAQLLEVIAWIALKTLTNYVNHIAETPVDDQWKGQSWTAQAA
jgi:uncharacterized peroxidase-related enzyme